MTTTERVTYHVHYVEEDGSIQEVIGSDDMDDVIRDPSIRHAVLTNSHGRVLAIGTPGDVAIRWAECYADD